MTWNTPRAWAPNELVTAGNMNLYISDLLAYLKGSAGTVSIDSALSIAGGTAWHSGNDGSGSGLDADVLDGLQASQFWRPDNDGSGSGLDADMVDGFQASQSIVGNAVVVRDASGYITTGYLNTSADNQGATIPARIAGQNGDNFLRWYNETNWLRFKGIFRQAGSLDLGQASAAGNIGRFVIAHAWGGNLTISASGSAGILLGAAQVGSFVANSGDSYTLFANGDNNWDVC